MSSSPGGDGFLRVRQLFRTSQLSERGNHSDGQLNLSTTTRWCCCCKRFYQQLMWTRATRLWPQQQYTLRQQRAYSTNLKSSWLTNEKLTYSVRPIQCGLFASQYLLASITYKPYTVPEMLRHKSRGLGSKLHCLKNIFNIFDRDFEKNYQILIIFDLNVLNTTDHQMTIVSHFT